MRIMIEEVGSSLVSTSPYLEVHVSDSYALPDSTKHVIPSRKEGPILSQPTIGDDDPRCFITNRNRRTDIPCVSRVGNLASSSG
jgi:hypothetical protein